MQNNNFDLEIEEENLNKIDNDKEELDKINFIKAQNLDYLNNLKSQEYDQIISEMYFDVDLEEEDNEDNNEINERKMALFSDLLKKLPDNKAIKEKKKRGNKVIKDGMGLLLSLDVTEPPLLYQSYKHKNNFFDTYLYSINISTLEQSQNYGFIFPIDFGASYKIKLFNRKSRQVIYAEIIREKFLRLNNNQMMDVITYHLCISNQLIRGKKNIDMNNLNFFLNTLDKNGKYKKYFFVPIFRNNKNIIEIDAESLEKCINYSKENYYPELFPKISEIISPNLKKSEIKEIVEYLKTCFLITDYKMSKMYKLEDIIYKNDNFNTFINKYTFNNPELTDEIKNKLLEYLDKYNKKDINKINAKFIMEGLSFDEEDEIKSKEILGPITGFRRIPKKYKIDIDNNNKYYLSCKFGPSNFCKQTNFIYNTNILKTIIEVQNEITITFKDKEPNQNTVEKYTKILPPDRVFCYYIEQKDIDFFEYIPSIFINLEELLKITQFISDFNLIQENNIKQKNYIEKNYPFIQWAFTLHSYVQDYNYESLETLGDSILKMLATTLVYHINELNNIETNVDKLVFGRKTLVCNLHLYNKGLKSKIYNYIIRYPKEILSYSFPLEHEKIITGIINISEKIVADIVESSIGGMFLLTRNLKDCFDYLIKLELPFVEKDDYKFKETKGLFAKNSIWNTNNEYKSLVDNSCRIMYKKFENFDKFIFPEKISDIINEKEININIDINLRVLMQRYLLRCFNGKRNYKGNLDSLDYLQQCKIFYNFKNKKLLQQAMTHKSKNYSNSQNYEKLELLGDSIVEIFISQYTFCLFSPYLFQDPNENDEENEKNLNDYEKLIKKNAKIFNNKYMTHVKSYLCSNYFMCKLSILIGLPKYLQFSENNINMKKQLDQFLDFNNIKNFVESPLNNYISTEIYQPKFIADLFEALIGAIYIDSDLKTTYEFLHLIYGPSICYSCLYLEELPFSIVADFTEKCSKELKIVPSFKNVSKEEIVNSKVEYFENKYYLKLTIGKLFEAIDMGDNEEKAKENLSEKGLAFLEKIRFQGPNENN